MAKKYDHPIAWAWKLEDDGGLCHWAEPTKDKICLESPFSPPSPGATPVRVRLVPLAEYKKLTQPTPEPDGGKRWRAKR